MKKVANLFEFAPEALVGRVAEPLVAGHIAYPTEMVFKGRANLAGKTLGICSAITPERETIALGVSSCQGAGGTAAPSLGTEFALNNETPATPYQHPAALWEAISYTALYFLKHFILTFILQPNTTDLFPYEACTTLT